MNNQKYLIAANWKQNGDSKSLIKLINDFIKLQRDEVESICNSQGIY